jgi:hypothetical protein
MTLLNREEEAENTKHARMKKPYDGCATSVSPEDQGVCEFVRKVVLYVSGIASKLLFLKMVCTL